MVKSSRVRLAVGPQNSRPRHYSSSARGRHPRGCPTGFGYTRSHVSAPWGVKSITNSSRYKERPTRQTSQLLFMPSASSFGRSPWCGQFVNSTTRAQKLTASSAISHDLRMTLGRTLLSLVRSRMVAQLERCGCPILYTLVPFFFCFSSKTTEKHAGHFFSGVKLYFFFFGK